MTDLTAKARRAAEWCNANDPLLTIEQVMNGWGVYFKSGGKFAVFGCDRLLVAFCEDRGWQDQEQEADGVEVLSEQQKVGSYLARWGMRKEGNWNWIVLCPHSGQSTPQAQPQPARKPGGRQSRPRGGWGDY